MLVSVGALVCYLTGLLGQFACIRGKLPARRAQVLGFTASGAIFHTVALFCAIHTQQGINLGVMNIASLTTLMVTLVVLLSSLRKPAESLLLFILPFTMLAFVFAWLSPAHSVIWRPPPAMVVHVLISVLAYGLLMVAAFQSLLLSYQEYQLRNHRQKRTLQALPSLQTMERLMFEFLLVGVIFLTLSLLSGFLFFEDMFGQQLVHKMVFSLVAWCVFTGLLLGHRLWGWRGLTAMRWILAGFLLLILSYFGWRLAVNILAVK